MKLNIKQILLVTAVQIALTFIIFFINPDFLQKLIHGPEFYDSGVSNTFEIIFKWGVITMLVLGIPFIGKSVKNEVKYFLFSEVFLAIVFYKTYNNNTLVLTLIFLSFALIIFLLRIPIRKFIIRKEILA